MRLAKIQLANLGPFDDVTLEIPPPAPGQLGELVLFEGPNGSGKTTLLESIVGAMASYMGMLPHGHDPVMEQRLRPSSHGLFGWQPSGSGNCFYLQVSSEGRVSADFSAITIDENFELFPLIQRHRIPSPLQKCAFFSYRSIIVTPNLASQGPREFGDDPMQTALSFGQRGTFSEHFGQILTNLESERTKAMAYALERPEERERLEQRAKSLLASRHRMEQALSAVLDREVRFTFELQRQAPRVLFEGEEVLLDLLGEGMRRTFSWLADLMARLELTQWQDTSRSPFDQDFLLFLDEVDQSLHPTMQMRLMPTLRKLFPRARIYATTHSPFVVASVEEGYVFSIRPDATTHRVRGVIEPEHLQGGRTLESVVQEVFDAPAVFIDEKTRRALEKHKDQVDALRRSQKIDAQDFFANRRLLYNLSEEVRTVVAMREVPARQKIADLERQTEVREAGE